MGKERTRSLESFADSFTQLTQECIRKLPGVRPGGPPLFKIPVKTPGQALNLAMQIRQFWNALRAARERGEISSTLDPRYAMMEYLDALAVRVYPRGSCFVEIVHKEQMITTRAINEVLGQLDKALMGSVDLSTRVPEANPAVVERLTPAKAKDAQDSALEEQYGVKPAEGRQ